MVAALPVLDLAAFRADPSSPEAAEFVTDLLRAAHEVCSAAARLRVA